MTTDTLRHNFYVDDLLKSVPTPEDGITLMEQLIEPCAKGGFNLTKFVINNRKVCSAIPRVKRADPSLDVNLEELPVDRALGVRWHIESDTFGLKVVELGKINTMRGVLSTSARSIEPCCVCNVACEVNHARPVENEKGVGSTPRWRTPPKMVAMEGYLTPSGKRESSQMLLQSA